MFILIDLGVVGKACPQRYSAKDKERMEEQRILAKLREEGLIQRPMSRASGGMAFEVVADIEADKPSNPFAIPSPRRPPVRLAKLEKRKKKKRLTQEDIDAKLAKADQRRKVSKHSKIDIHINSDSDVI